MRKLVLSGFLASEEIYINQLEALLLVSTRSDLRVGLRTALGVEEDGGPGSVFPCGQSLRRCSADSLATGGRSHCQKGPVPPGPTLPYLLWESTQALLINHSTLSRWGPSSASTLSSGQCLPVSPTEPFRHSCCQSFLLPGVGSRSPHPEALWQER